MNFFEGSDTEIRYEAQLNRVGPNMQMLPISIVVNQKAM